MKPVSQLQHSQFNGTHEQHHLKVFAAKLRSQRRENSHQRKQSHSCCTCRQSSVQFNVQFHDEWITVQRRKICRLVTQVLGQFFVNVTPSSRGSKPVDVWLPAQQRSLADESQELELSCHRSERCVSVGLIHVRYSKANARYT